ncbi:MAG: hypothetical protein K2X39_05870, partial [Silvanigrellaceae bacterium]|nr:hypothetical protein [Silvanigrellaceae bacterium]
MIKKKTRRRILSVAASFVCFFSCYSFAQHTFHFDDYENLKETPPPTKTYEEGVGGLNGLKFAPKSLVELKLSPAAYPEETELFCSVVDQCVFGFTRGIVVGSNVFGMLYSPAMKMMHSSWITGNFHMLDAFAGFQILRGADKTNFANAQIGIKRLSYQNSYGNELLVQGVTIRVNYAQLITPTYLQGLTFHAFPATIMQFSKMENFSLDAESNSRDYAQKTVKYMYKSLQKFPTYMVSLPAELEVANFAMHKDVMQPLRVYGHAEPYYKQIFFSISDKNAYDQIQEENIGIRLAGIAAFESKEATKNGRYGVRFDLGFEMNYSYPKETCTTNVAQVRPHKQALFVP